MRGGKKSTRVTAIENTDLGVPPSACPLHSVVPVIYKRLSLVVIDLRQPGYWVISVGVGDALSDCGLGVVQVCDLHDWTASASTELLVPAHSTPLNRCEGWMSLGQ